MCHHSEKAHIKDRPKPKSGSKHHPVRIIITAVNSDFIQTFQRLFLTHFSVSIYSLCLLDSSETNRSKCTKLCSLWCAVMFTLRGWAQTLSNQLHGAFSWILLACFYQGLLTKVHLSPCQGNCTRTTFSIEGKPEVPVRGADMWRRHWSLRC